MFNRLKTIMALALSRMLGHTSASLNRIARDHNRTVDAVRTAEALGQTRLGSFREHWAARLIPARYSGRRATYRGPNGVQAMARRVRQQWIGHNAASALWINKDGQRWHRDSHGAHHGFYWNRD